MSLKRLASIVRHGLVAVVLMGLLHYPITAGAKFFDIPAEVLAVTGTFNTVLLWGVNGFLSLFTDPQKSTALTEGARTLSTTIPNLLVPILLGVIGIVVVVGAVQILRDPEWVKENGGKILGGIFNKKALPFWGGLLLLGGTVIYVLSLGSVENALGKFIIPLGIAGLLALAASQKKWFEKTIFKPIISIAEGVIMVGAVLMGVLAVAGSFGAVSMATITQWTSNGILIDLAKISLFIGSLADPIPLAIVLTIGVIILWQVVKDDDDEGGD